MKILRSLVLAAGMFACAVPAVLTTTTHAAAATKQDLDKSANDALDMLYKNNPVASQLSKRAKAILVFPQIIKAGLVFGAAYGEGALKMAGAPNEYYNTFTGSWGLQIGAQSYGYALFLMNDKAINYLHQSNGWEIGAGPTVVVVDKGIAENLSTTTLKDDVYAVIFDQKGLMAGLSLEGTKISRIKQ